MRVKSNSVQQEQTEITEMSFDQNFVASVNSCEEVSTEWRRVSDKNSEGDLQLWLVA
jgi:hypothetical protein